MKSNYSERQANRLAAFQRLAEKNQQASSSSYQSACRLGSVIPMGQPILVGHHSESAHRAQLKRIDTAMRKSVECDKKAVYYESRAKSIEKSNVISSDNPEAIELLQKKIDSLQRNQELMKAINKILKTKKTDAQKVEEMQAAGLGEKNALEMLKPDYMGRIGFPSYSLQNNNANIATAKKRLQFLQSVEAMPYSRDEYGENIIEVCPDDNRVKIFFPGKPSDEIRSLLKHRGFRWAPSEGAWMRQISNQAIWAAKEIAQK